MLVQRLQIVCCKVTQVTLGQVGGIFFWELLAFFFVFLQSNLHSESFGTFGALQFTFCFAFTVDNVLHLYMADQTPLMIVSAFVSFTFVTSSGVSIEIKFCRK